MQKLCQKKKKKGEKGGKVSICAGSDMKNESYFEVFFIKFWK